jgi:hypothetical protein
MSSAFGVFAPSLTKSCRDVLFSSRNVVAAKILSKIAAISGLGSVHASSRATSLAWKPRILVLQAHSFEISCVETWNTNKFQAFLYAFPPKACTRQKIPRLMRIASPRPLPDTS